MLDGEDAATDGAHDCCRFGLRACDANADLM
jgi:hypothetical protein